MTLIVEDSEEVCLHCSRLRKTFILIAISAVAPILVFAALLLIISGRLHPDYKITTNLVVEFSFGLLYIQHLVATSVLIISFVKRRQQILKCHVWYMIFHLVVTWLVVCSSVVLTCANDSHLLTILVLVVGIAYFSVIYRCMKTNKYPWTALRRVY